MLISAMKKAILPIFLVAIFASCIEAQTKWLWDFEGTLGTQKIGFTLHSAKINEFVRGHDLDCSYFYVRFLKDIRLRCNIEDDGSFNFVELDENGNSREIIHGIFVDNKIDVLEGKRTDSGNGRTLPFKLKLSQGMGGDAAHRYDAIDAPNDKEFERKVQAFRNAILNGRKQTVVSFIQFPITVEIGKKRTRIRNKLSFLKNYDKILDKDFVEEVRKTIPHNLFHRDIGAMLGNGSIWFWGDGKVIAINN